MATARYLTVVNNSFFNGPITLDLSADEAEFVYEVIGRMRREHYKLITGKELPHDYNCTVYSALERLRA